MLAFVTLPRVKTLDGGASGKRLCLGQIVPKPCLFVVSYLAIQAHLLDERARVYFTSAGHAQLELPDEVLLGHAQGHRLQPSDQGVPAFGVDLGGRLASALGSLEHPFAVGFPADLELLLLADDVLTTGVGELASSSPGMVSHRGQIAFGENRRAERA